MTQAVTRFMVVASVIAPALTAASSSPGATAVVPDARTPYLVVESTRSVGNKGEEHLDVSVQAPCGESALLFDHAELVVRRNRFGDAQFVGLPQPGCVHCAPVSVRWFHEPTGYLSFEIHVYRRMEVVLCPANGSHHAPGPAAAPREALEPVPD